MLKFVFLLFVIFSLSAAGQDNQMFSMDEAVAVAMANHPIALNMILAEHKDVMLQQQFFELAPLQVKYWQRNAALPGNYLLWSITQDFGSIPEHFRRAQHYRAISSTHQAERSLTLDKLACQVKAAYMDFVYYCQRLQIMQEHAHYFEAIISLAEIHLFADSVTYLSKVSAGARYAAYQSRMYIAGEELNRAEMRLRQLMYISEGKIEASQTKLELYQIHPDKPFDERFDPVKHTILDAAQLVESESAVKLEKSKLYPAFHAGYIYQNIDNSYHGWMVGLSLPLWAQPQRARIKQAEIGAMKKAVETEYRQFADRQHVEML